VQELGLWGGGAPATANLMGIAEDQRLALLALRYGVVFAHTRDLSFQYTADVFPFAAVFQPENYRITGIGRFRGRTVTAFGAAPVGFKVTARRKHLVQPFVDATGGMLRSRIPIPADLPEATRWNFTFDFGGGIQLLNIRGKAFRIGYRFHHLSNAGRSAINPGLDSHIVYVGFSVFR